MKLTSMTKAVIAVAGISAFAFAQAQDYGRGLSLNPGGGYYAFDSELRLDDGSFPSIGIEYRMTDSVAVELNYLQSDTTDAVNTLAEYDVEQIRLDGNYYFTPERKLQPYLSGGVGMFNLVQIEKQIDNEDTIADLGAGIRYFFNEHFSLRSDIRAINNLDSGYTDGLLNVGINLLLGGNSVSSSGDIDLVDNQADLPVAGLDADMDGVLDAKDQCPETMAGLATDSQGCPADVDMDGIADYSDDCLDTMDGLMVDENGCAIPVESTVSMDLNVNFEFESAELPPEFYSDVKELATFLKLYKDSEVTIEGHADATGTEEFNLSLSEKRARAIRDILVRDFEIQRDRLKFVGYGEGRPVADNKTEEGRSKNRRAATVVSATREPQDTAK